jgi:hypothetical protein
MEVTEQVLLLFVAVIPPRRTTDLLKSVVAWWRQEASRQINKLDCAMSTGGAGWTGPVLCVKARAFSIFFTASNRTFKDKQDEK